MSRSSTAVFAVGLLAGLLAPAGVGTAGADVRVPCQSARGSDFNGDGFSDAVVGDPDQAVGGASLAGVIHVRSGVAGGKVGAGADSVITQADLGETAENFDRFGAVLKVGYVDIDTCADVVIGVPGEDVDGATDAGIVQIIFGSTAGLGKGTPSLVIRPGAGGVPGTPAAGDGFGSAIDPGGPGVLDHALVIGSPGKDVGAATDAGQVTYMRFIDGHVQSPVNVTQDSAGVPGTAEAGDRFGAAVTRGRLLGADFGIGVGAPGEDLGTLGDAGSVTAITNPGDTSMSGTAVTQDSTGVSGAAEAGDRFGASLALTRGGSLMMAVGVPGEDVGTVADAGMVHVLDANLGEVTSITQDSAGVGDTAEAGDRFGDVLSLASADGSATTARLAVGVPAEDRGTVADAGVVQEFRIGGPDNLTNALIDQESVGGVSQPGDHFGASVTYAGIALTPSWIIGVPNDVAKPSGVVYVDYTRLGGPSGTNLQTWTPDQGTTFGSAVAGNTQ